MSGLDIAALDAVLAASLDKVARSIAADALRAASQDMELPGSSATGYYSSGDTAGYREAERDAIEYLLDRAHALDPLVDAEIVESDEP